MVDVVATNAKLRRRMVRMVEQATGADHDRAEQTLDLSNGRVRVAIVALQAGVDVTAAAEALTEAPPDPARRGDPSGLRTAGAAAGEAAPGQGATSTSLQGDGPGGRGN